MFNTMNRSDETHSLLYGLEWIQKTCINPVYVVAGIWIGRSANLVAQMWERVTYSTSINGKWKPKPRARVETQIISSANGI